MVTNYFKEIFYFKPFYFVLYKIPKTFDYTSTVTYLQEVDK